MGFRLRFLLILFLFLLASGLLLQIPAPVSAQSADLLFEEEACREDPHSEDCICAAVRRYGDFPKEFNPDGTPKDADRDGHAPLLEGRMWVDAPDESVSGEESDLEFMSGDRYSQGCSLAYFRENLRRLWYFAVSLGAAFTVISLIWVGVVHMQNTASGVDISRTRAMLVRVSIGIIIIACSSLIFEGLNAVLFTGLDSWTLERGVFYTPR